MRDKAWVGIDVACAKGKSLPIVVCVMEGKTLVPLKLRSLPELVPPKGMGNACVIDSTVTKKFAADAVTYVSALVEYYALRICVVGIDAPSAYADNGSNRRAAEVALDRAGISCFTTPTRDRFDEIVSKAQKHIGDGLPISRVPHANQLWMLAGFALFEAFSNLAKCREVYPQATVQVLGAADIYKAKKEGLARQLQVASRHTGWPSQKVDVSVLDDIAFATRHDNLDAYLSAWVASLDRSDLFAFGEPPDDVIWVPKVEKSSSIPAFTKISGSEKRKVTSTMRSATKRLCPACRKHEFKRWPLGWDAHAAHKCSGLSGSDIEERKQEFRQRYSFLFNR